VDDEFIEEVKIHDAWVPLYRFGLQEAFLPDYEVNNWYTSTHPRNLFVNELLAARPAPGRRYALRNNQFTVHHLNGRTENLFSGSSCAPIICGSRYKRRQEAMKNETLSPRGP
jgi:arylamine N-acetyltransferase